MDDEKTVEITRLATRPERPANTASWLISRARDWARLEGYKKLIAYTGIANNEGTVYKACGFELDDVSESDGLWSNREGRKDYDTFTRRRYKYSLGDINRK